MRDFGLLYEQEGLRLWRAVFAFSGDPDVANDAVAEAFAQCLRRGDAVRDPRAWVWRSAFRIAAGELKERRRRTGAPIQTPSYDLPESTDHLMAAIAQLSGQQRAALLLRHYAGYETKEVARIIGTSQATVRVHLSRGRKRLRELLEEPDED
jgi:RNA polymerase sigma-70 factor, ECF subfamily